MGVLTTVPVTGRLLLAPLVAAAMVVSLLLLLFPSLSPTLLARTATMETAAMEVTEVMAETGATVEMETMKEAVETEAPEVTAEMVAQEATEAVAVTEVTEVTVGTEVTAAMATMVVTEALGVTAAMEDQVVMAAQAIALTVKTVLMETATETEATHLPSSSTRRSRSKAQALYPSF